MSEYSYSPGVQRVRDIAGATDQDDDWDVTMKLVARIEELERERDEIHRQGVLAGQVYRDRIEALERERAEIPISIIAAIDKVRDARREALEEAARVCEDTSNKHGWNYHLPSVGRELANRIRALKEKE